MSSASSGSSDEADSNGRHPRYSRHASLVLYTLWPALVQHRIQKLGDSIHDFIDKRSRHQRVSSLDSDDDLTPPQSYAGSPREHCFPQEPPRVSTWIENTTQSRPSSSGSTTPTFVGEPVQEDTGSGIQWRYAKPGFSSLILAQSEDMEASVLNPLFARRQYISGVACLLHGLPTDLSEEEAMNLREALPAALKPVQRNDTQLAMRSAATREQGCTQQPHQQTTLQHLVAVCTMYLFLAASFVFPYVQQMLRAAYRFDRRHKISDRVLSHSIETADAMRRSTFTMAAQVCSMNDGKVGEQLKDVSIYLVQGLSGGVYDGIGEGMQVLGLRTSREQ